MTRFATKLTATIAVGSLVLATSTIPATAAYDDGSNWANPSTLGLNDCTFHGPFIDAPHKGVFEGEEVPRRRWVCSSFDITFAVYRYATTADAKTAAQPTIGDWHSRYALNHGCWRNSDAGGCGTVRSVGAGHVFAGDDKVDYGVKVSIAVWSSAGAYAQGWTQGAWVRSDRYVVVAEQSSLHYAGGYFTASDLVNAAKQLANNPPSGISVNSFTDSNPNGDNSTTSPATKKKSQRAKAKAAASGTQTLAKQRGKRYNKLKTPTVKQLRSNGTGKSAAKKARFSGFRPRPAKRVWIKVGDACIRAKGKKSGKWKTKSCPNVRWTKARR